MKESANNPQPMEDLLTKHFLFYIALCFFVTEVWQKVWLETYKLILISEKKMFL